MIYKSSESNQRSPEWYALHTVPKFDSGTFHVTPDWAWTGTLTSGARLLLLDLCRHDMPLCDSEKHPVPDKFRHLLNFRKGLVWQSRSTIAKRTGIKPSTLTIKLKELADCGFIEIIGKPGETNDVRICYGATPCQNLGDLGDSLSKSRKLTLSKSGDEASNSKNETEKRNSHSPAESARLRKTKADPLKIEEGHRRYLTAPENVSIDWLLSTNERCNDLILPDSEAFFVEVIGTYGLERVVSMFDLLRVRLFQGKKIVSSEAFLREALASQDDPDPAKRYRANPGDLRAAPRLRDRDAADNIERLVDEEVHSIQRTPLGEPCVGDDF